MVKFSIFKKTIRAMVCMLAIAIATNVSAQNYPPRSANSTNSADMGEALIKGVSNLFKKKDKGGDADKKNKTEKTEKSKKSKDDVELIVSGDGATKEEATKAALRSAIEQTYGTFVSSNTNILNDNLVKDEIVTVSSGNVKEYTYLGENEANGKCHVTIKAIVSIGKLVQYVQSKGGEAELAGETFVMDVKLKEFYKKNEEMALQNLMTQLEELMPLAFDYSISIDEPHAEYQRYACNATIVIKSNKNYKNVRNLIWETLGALCIKRKAEYDDYRTKGVEPCEARFYTGSGTHSRSFLKLPVTYLEKEGDDWTRYRENEKYFVGFRSDMFFERFDGFISSLLGHFVINDGLRDYVYSERGGYSSECSFTCYEKGGERGEFSGERLFKALGRAIRKRGGPIDFPVEQFVIWTLKGRIYFTKEELANVKKIKVLPPSPSDIKYIEGDVWSPSRYRYEHISH